MKDSRREYRNMKKHSFYIAWMTVLVTIERRKEDLAKAETQEEIDEIMERLEQLGNFKEYLELEIKKRGKTI